MTTTTASSPACPSWCDHHYDIGDSSPLEEQHFGATVATPIGELGTQVYVHDDGRIERLIFRGDDNLSADQARETAAALLRLADLIEAP